MKIITQTGFVFDLPTSFDAGFTRYNSILSDEGDQTLPITLPATDEAKQYFSYSHRIDNWFKPVIDHEVIVSDGVISKKANLSLNSLDFSSGISCTLYLAAGDFYSRIDKKKLSSLNWETVKHPDYDNVTLDDRRQYLIDLCVACITDVNYSTKFGVVPAVTSTNYTLKANVVNEDNTTYTSQNISGLFIMNGPERFKQNDGNVIPRITTLEGSTEQTIVQDSIDVNTKKGYGITPFLKIGYVFDVLFSSYGYTYDVSNFLNYMQLQGADSALYWKSILLANPVADSIYGGKLEEKQLLPDCYISDFLKELSGLMAGKFIIDEVEKKAVFKMYESVLLPQSAQSIDRYVSSDEKLEMPEFKTIVISDGSDTGNNEDGDDIEKITFNIIKRNPVTMSVNELVYDVLSGNYYNTNIKKNFYLNNINIPVIHKNSAVESNGKIITEEDNEFTDIVLVYHTIAGMYTGFRPQSSIPWFDVAGLQKKYSKYSNFRQNSNIPGTVSLSMPRVDFYNLDLSLPVLLNNQPILIKQLEGSLTSDPVEVKCSFVTLRSYV